MSMEQVFYTNSEAETLALAETFADRLLGGEVICLRGDLGAGKTVFSKGLCKALGVTEHVSSPTFCLVNEYEGERFPIYHFDLYRIEDPDELYEIGFSEFTEGAGVAIIEWPQRAEEMLPAKRIEVSIDRDGDDRRKVTVKEL
ncbi:MAG: tRNA (adenosine(37)-N6)-threonylcarbamoyltransferase complex ATPase subunit type 1 TsaE [Clostridia bacterium]|nr:tRNA (adenosine(37)-N6)-threonylcarbamoyltransferase complex ATPase subunit type 1 TsaE [Clostridia bacterium]